ncbi:MAG: hypothetical protein ACXV7D_06230 [Thermoanaerobaculia bacterium]
MLRVSAVRLAPLTSEQRIEAARAVERARYAFVIGTKPPFDERYPQTFFVAQLEKQTERERVLREVFGITITEKDLAREFERIETSTKAPDQWEAMKAAVNHDPLVVQEVVCRPLLVGQILRARFGFDQHIHAAQHEQARTARAEFLAGRKPANACVLRISRHPDPSALSLEPEARTTLDKELHEPGDVSTILEYVDRFEVYRLREITSDFWSVDVVRVAKRGFDSWYEEVQGKTK